MSTSILQQSMFASSSLTQDYLYGRVLRSGGPIRIRQRLLNVRSNTMDGVAVAM